MTSHAPGNLALLEEPFEALVASQDARADAIAPRESVSESEAVAPRESEPREKLVIISTFLSSRRVAPAAVMRCYDWATVMRDTDKCIMGGFQNALERDVLKLLLPIGGPPIIMALAHGMWRSVPAEYREAIDARRMLVVSPFPQGVVRRSRETAEKRTAFALDHCDEAVFASLNPEGTLARLVADRPGIRYRVLP